MKGKFNSLTNASLNIKNDNKSWNFDTTFFGLKPPQISSHFRGYLYDKSNTVAFDVANSSLTKATIRTSSHSATGGTGSINTNATLSAGSFTHDGFGNTV